MKLDRGKVGEGVFPDGMWLADNGTAAHEHALPVRSPQEPYPPVRDGP